MKLLNRLENTGQFHVDCTYKIIKYFYPLLVFGITDYGRYFYTIAFIVTSHETDSGFKHFFQTLNSVSNELGIKFALKTVVSDACQAMFDALNSVYPDTSYMVDMMKSFCSCIKFFDKRSCKHLIACALLADKLVLDLPLNNKFNVRYRQRNKSQNKLVHDSDDEISFEEESIASLQATAHIP